MKLLKSTKFNQQLQCVHKSGKTSFSCKRVALVIQIISNLVSTRCKYSIKNIDIKNEPLLMS